EPVLAVDRDVVPVEREDREGVVSDVRIRDLLVCSPPTERRNVVRPEHGCRPGVALLALILIEAEAIRSAIAIVVLEEAAGKLFAETIREVDFVAAVCVGSIIFGAADLVDAGENPFRIRAPGTGLAGLVGIKIAAQRDPLAAEAASDVQ